jgi:hypothetical protein
MQENEFTGCAHKVQEKAATEEENIEIAGILRCPGKARVRVR